MSETDKFATFDYVYKINNSSNSKDYYLNKLITGYMWDSSNENNGDRYMNVTEINNTFDNLKTISTINGEMKERFAYNSNIILQSERDNLKLYVYPDLYIDQTNDISYLTNIPNMSTTIQIKNQKKTQLTGRIKANTFYYIGFRVDDRTEFSISISNYSSNLMNVVNDFDYLDTNTQKSYKSISFYTVENLTNSDDCEISFSLIK